MFTTFSLLFGALAAVMIGLSKSALPGAGLLAIPLLAEVAIGRGIAGTMLPMLLVADVFVVFWYGRHSRYDVLRPLIAPVAAGFVAGAAFFIAIGSANRILEVTLGVIVGALVILQLYRTIRSSPPVVETPMVTRATGLVGGFTTFVANAAGPVLNTYFLALGLSKNELIGSSAWFYFMVNAAKIPLYIGLMWFTSGGAFFTAESLLYDAVLSPLVVVGAFGGRYLLTVMSQHLFNNMVIVLGGMAALKMIVGA